MKVQFEAGTSRHGNSPVNFLISEDHSLYAEILVPEGASEDYGYLSLKAEILRQAAAAGIAAESLEFWYDGQEQFLAPDAAAQGDSRLWYAVMTDSDDTDWGTGSYDKEEALQMVRDRLDVYPDGYVAVIDVSTDNPVCIDEIHC